MSEALAERFHEIYESCAHDYGYETRKDSAVPWGDVPQKNKTLMIYVCGIIEKEFIHSLRQENEELNADLTTTESAVADLMELNDKLTADNEALKAVIQMCFVDACSQSGKISKATARELMKHADTRA